ncbi:hypothetical protein CVT24_010090 [Panaeolus cyanescens]|uniref:non-specific serine/threonine protein kinase n=1 Tax=Panaeolus cyanescens TaxID=181874 RepID=A0A409YQ25_9AGAR|nr:hypothetical protein CVT24_010090 [Panaeolus cyanescens]
MKAFDTNLPSSSRRGPVRMDNQDGPWSVSVAETPDDSRSYSLYVKSEFFSVSLYFSESLCFFTLSDCFYTIPCLTSAIYPLSFHIGACFFNCANRFPFSLSLHPFHSKSSIMSTQHEYLPIPSNLLDLDVALNLDFNSISASPTKPDFTDITATTSIAPTHNLTLTRTAMEVVELDQKLRSSNPNLKLPPLPIDPATLPIPPKKKSTFLNTLSRLASPTSAKVYRQAYASHSHSHGLNGVSTNLNGSLNGKIASSSLTASPAAESADPFGSFNSASAAGSTDGVDGVSSAVNGSSASGANGASAINGVTSSEAKATGMVEAVPSTTNGHANGLSSSTTGLSSPEHITPPPPSATATALAAYLTTLSNILQLRSERTWKRFVRVRTDDLESVRVERAIKRVRSDLAAHVSVGATKKDEAKENEAPTVPIGTLPERTISVEPETADAAFVAAQLERNLEEEEKRNRKVEEVVVPPAAVDPASTTPAPPAPSTSDTPAEHDVVASEPTPADAEKGVDVADVVPEPEATETVEPTPVSVETKEPVPIDTSVAAPSTTEASIQEPAPSTPVAAAPVPHPAPSDVLRMHRSQSAEPVKGMQRIQRAYTASVPSQTDGGESQTCDEESESQLEGTDGGGVKSGRRRKKRGVSTARVPRKSDRKVVIDDFEMMRVLGKGCAGKVLLVRHKTTSDLFALKAITKRHVLAHQELQHTLTEQAVLKRMAAENRDPFVVKLWWSFHDKENLFLVMDFHPGGDLATQLARWGRLGRDRARFYAAEIVEGVEGLHAAGVIYRDLKPENILIGGDGHIVLTDFGLSKEFPRKISSTPLTASGALGEDGRGFYSSVPGTPQLPTSPPWMKPDRNGEMAFGWPGQPIGHSDQTTTFCGTAEYLAPEVIQGMPYSYEVDWWSFGTMLYEMLTGITPFWATNHSDMYVRVLQDELHFPDDRAIDQDTKSLIRGLLQRAPSLRICEPRIKKHPYFSMIDWTHVYYKRYIPPYIPPIDPSNASDTQNFDDTFLDMEPVLDDFNEDETGETDQEPQTDTDRTDGDETNTTPSQSRSSSMRPQRQPQAEEDVDVFDGYSFKGRHSVLIDDEEEEGSEEGSGEDEQSILDDDGTSISRTTESEGVTAEEDEEEHEAQAEEQLEDGLEPKTPEARPPASLPVVEEDIQQESVPVEEAAPVPASDAVPTPSEAPAVQDVVEVKRDEVRFEEPPKRHSRDLAAIITQPSTAEKTSSKPAATRRTRREKSGVPALDKYLSEVGDDDAEATEAEREDEDWDFVEAGDGEDRNGAKGTSLFARGVVDRYKLAVFRKASTPTAATPRTVSNMSSASSFAKETESPSPSQKRGRRPLTFGKGPRQFLKPKSPPSSYSAKSARSISQTASKANTLSAASSSSTGGLLTPSLSQGSTFANSPSLKSKESATSVGATSQSSDQSTGMSAVLVDASDLTKDPSQSVPTQNEKVKTKKLKKYKNNAEKMFSIFSSPKQNQQQAS